MFKKRTQSKKQANIDDILTEITTQEQPSDPAQQIPKNVEPGNEENRGVEAKGRGMGKGVTNRGGRPVGHVYEEEGMGDVGSNAKEIRELSGSQIEQCFAQFLKHQKQNSKAEEQQNIPYPSIYNYNHTDIEQQQQPHEHFQQQFQSYQQPYPQNEPKLMTHQVIIQDQSGQQIEVREDYGQISPDISNSDEQYQQGYQNQIIKKTLSKFNYQQVSKSLSAAHGKNKQNKLLKELGKVSYSSVQRKIARDLRAKRERKGQLVNEVRYIENKIKQRQSQIGEKMKSKDRAEIDLDKIKRIIEILYYYGSELEIQNIDEVSLSQLVYQQQWKDRIDRIRSTISKNKKQFDKKIKKQQDGQSNKAKSDGSEGDVQEIGRRGGNKDQWEGEMDQQEEQGGRQYVSIDDDQCIEIDDDD